MDKKVMNSIANRLKKAHRSFGAMGSLLLIYDVKAMSKEEKNALKAFLIEKNVNFSVIEEELNQ